MPVLAKVLDPGFLKLAAVGVAGVALLGYTVYFDYKRTTAPDYKDRIRQKRRQEAERVKREFDEFNAFPNPNDQAAQQQYFMRQLARGDELFSAGRVDEAVVHMANGVIVSNRSNEILSLMQQTMPTPHFLALIRALPAAKERYMLSCQRTDSLNLFNMFRDAPSGAVASCDGDESTVILDDSLDLE